MSNVTFLPNQPVRSLSGTYADAVFRTLPSGRTVVHLRPDNDDAPRPQRIIERCTAAIQLRMGDMREAIRQRRAITKRVQRLYGRLYQLTDSDDQLVTYILQAYYHSRRKLPSRAQTATFIGSITYPSPGHIDV